MSDGLDGEHDRGDRIQEALREFQEAAGGAHADRRETGRTRIQLTLNVFLLDGAVPTPLQAQTRDLSPGGIGLVVQRRLRPGVRLAIPLRLPNRPGKILLAEVTFCRALTLGQHEVGARLLEAVDDPDGNGGSMTGELPRGGH